MSTYATKSEPSCLKLCKVSHSRNAARCVTTAKRNHQRVTQHGDDEYHIVPHPRLVASAVAQPRLPTVRCSRLTATVLPGQRTRRRCGCNACTHHKHGRFHHTTRTVATGRCGSHAGPRSTRTRIETTRPTGRPPGAARGASELRLHERQRQHELVLALALRTEKEAVSVSDART